jgi:hypothetical protein
MLDEPLSAAWSLFKEKRDFWQDHDFVSMHGLATMSFGELRPSVARLHQFIMQQYLTHGEIVLRSDIRAFLNAGYQLAPEQEIIYDIEIPHLWGVGDNLRGKHLIMRKEAASVADGMIGRLTLDAHVDYVSDMIGHCTINIPPNHYSADCIGVFEKCPGNVGGLIIGRTNGAWNIREAPFSSFLSRCTRGRIDRDARMREAFLHDITNPQGLDYLSLRKALRIKYDPGSYDTIPSPSYFTRGYL